MASPCEVLINSTDKLIAKNVGQAVAKEAWRIEDKYSRYLNTSTCAKINASNGKPVSIDEETYKLLDFARQCFLMSDGAFDITSGVLAKAWKFDGSDNIPEQDKIQPLLKYIGFDRVSLTENSVALGQGMEIDFGGIGKEYAVDLSLQIAKKLTSIPVLINFGGDIAASAPPRDGKPWQVGIEHPGFANSNTEKSPPLVVSISSGALATSGDARRFLLKDGERYSHVLNPKTGYSIVGAPKSITVTAPNCIQAGFIATLALLQGAQAEQFLQDQDIGHWCIW
ncbi:FAD:protein FMN transferase [Thalassotalea sp. ND16A]|uniref:FAD:protein FMN transferase n=1 Tax=Thalassotalea sp. ND16A TaxID=1535422 RepID=UPI00190F3709|nr:FAD:protein FMN transferase [Thalassotalea sp. ND16A]